MKELGDYQSNILLPRFGDDVSYFYTHRSVPEPGGYGGGGQETATGRYHRLLHRRRQWRQEVRAQRDSKQPRRHARVPGDKLQLPGQHPG